MREKTENAEKVERRYPVEPKAPPALAVDVGGSHVKVLLNGVDERRRFASGPKLTATQMVAGVLEQTEDWSYECVSVGVPAPVRDNVVLHDPYNLAKGWAGFDFETAFGKPTRSSTTRRCRRSAATRAVACCSSDSARASARR